MSCKEVGRHLQHYLDGDLDDLRAERLSAHLEECRRCGLEVETYERIKASLAARGTGPLPDDAVDRLTRFARRLADEDHAGP
jgi:anti-sigma factor (TIGR02949 family)